MLILKMDKDIKNRNLSNLKLYITLVLAVGIFITFILPFTSAAAEFAVNTFSCTPEEVVINDVFSCTAQLINNGDAAGAVNTATLFPDDNDWLESSSYPQASGTSVDPGQTVEVTFSGLRATKSGNNGFSKITLDEVTDTYVADNNIKVNTIDVALTVSNSASSAAMSAEFSSTAEVTAGGNIGVTLTFSVSSGGCSIGNQASQKTISGMQDGNKQSRAWTVTQGTSGDCKFTISAAATGSEGVASKTDSVSSTISCTNCPTSSSSSSSSSGAGGSGGLGGVAKYVLGELTSAETLVLGINEKAVFNISGVQHNVLVTNLTETEAKISVQSAVQKFTIVVANDIDVDLDEDEISDINIKLKSINILTKKATLIVTPVNLEKRAADKGEEGKGDEGAGTPSAGEAIGKIAEKLKEFNFLIWIIIGVIVAVIAVLYLYRHGIAFQFGKMRYRDLASRVLIKPGKSIIVKSILWFV